MPLPTRMRKRLALPIFLSFPSLSSTTTLAHRPPSIPESVPEPETEEISTAYGSYTIPAASVDEAYAALARLYGLALARSAPQALRAHLDAYSSALAELEVAGVRLCPYERGAILAGSLPQRMSARWAWEMICNEYKSRESCERESSPMDGWTPPTVDEEGYARLLAACEAEIVIEDE